MPEHHQQPEEPDRHSDDEEPQRFLDPGGCVEPDHGQHQSNKDSDDSSNGSEHRSLEPIRQRTQLGGLWVGSRG